MQWLNNDKFFYELVSAETLATIIELRVHPHISNICSHIHDYLLDSPEIPDLDETQGQCLLVLFNKLETELNILFRKETAFLFPCLKQNPQAPENCFTRSAIEMIETAQYKIIILVTEIRQLLNNYIYKDWSIEFKNCVSQLFELENAVFRWIHIEQNYLFESVQKENA